MVKKHISLFTLLCALLCMFVSSSCQHEGAAQSAATAADSTRLEDEAYARFKRLEWFYNNSLQDSLEAELPATLEFCRQHQRWTWYDKTYSLLVNSYIWLGNYEEAIAQGGNFYHDAIARNDAYGQALAFNNLAEAYNYQGMNDEAVRCFAQALSLYPDDANHSDLTPIYSGYCESLRELGRYETMDSVLAVWQTFLRSKPALPGSEECEIHANWHAYFHLARLKYFMDLNKLDSAAVAADSALYYARLEGYEPLTMASVFESCATLAEQHEDFHRMLECADSALAYIIEPSNLVVAKDLQSMALAKLGHYEEAYTALRQHKTISDSLLRVENRTGLSQLNKRYELSQLRMVRTSERLQARHQRMAILLVFGAIIILGLAAFIYLRHRASVRLMDSYDQLEDAFRRLEVANARAEEASRMKTKFIHQISHEIRTPLNILSGFTQVITTPGLQLDEAEMRDINQGIVDNTKRITGLVSKMLELADASSKAVIERHDNVLAMQIAAEATDASGISAAKHLTFDIDIAPGAEELTIVTNAQAATRALALLLDNARKFTQPAEASAAAGNTTLEGAAADVKHHALLRVTTDARDLVFTVEDNGIGVPKAEAEHIFEEFVQLDDYYDGTGIGLTVARSIAQRLGGNILLDTSYSPGARFVMTLPLKIT